MPRALPCLVLAAALAAGAWATAGADDPPRPLDRPLQADLDGDGSAELVSARETACHSAGETTDPPCPRDGLRSLVVELVDGCGTTETPPGAAGQPVRTTTLSREMDAVSFARIVDADGDGDARELAFELRAGATARGVQAKIVSFRADPAGCVAVRKTLFSYPRADSTGRRPKGTSFATGAVTIRDFSPSRRGLELRTSETYARAGDAGCCPSYRRVTLWRHVAARAAYAPYRTTLSKLRRR